MAIFATVLYNKYAGCDVLAVNAPYEDNQVVKSVDGRQWSKSLNCWMLPLNEGSIEGLRTMAGFFNVLLKESSSVQQYLDGLATTRAKAADIATSQDADLTSLPWADRLRDYQRVGISFMENAWDVLLGDDPGLGKTLQAISAVEMSGRKGSTLVLCPTGAIHGWGQEISSWTDSTFTAVSGKRKKKEKIEGFDTNYLIMNYGTAVYYRDLILAKHWDNVIVDEAHVMRNKKTQLFIVMSQITTKRKIFLTGNPMMNHVHDLWALLNLLRPGEFSSYWAFIKRYCLIEESRFGSKPIKTDPDMIEDLQKQLSTVMIRRKKKDVLTELPDKVYQSTRLTLEGEHKKIYNAMMENHRLSLMSSVDIQSDISKFSLDPSTKQKVVYFLSPDAARRINAAYGYTGKIFNIVASNYMELSRKVNEFRMSAHQYAITSYPDLDHLSAAINARGGINVGTILERTTRERQLLVSPRMIDPALPDVSPKLDDILLNLPDVLDGDRKAIIMSQWTTTFEILGKRLQDQGIKFLEFSGRNTTAHNDRNKMAFVEDDIHPVLLLSTIAGGVALNLQRASIGYRVDKLFNPFLDMQAEDRMHRMGQKEMVLINDYIMENTIEEDIELVVRQRKDDFEAVMDMKDVLEILRKR